MFRCSDEELISKFYNIKNRSDIASLLEIDEKSLRYILYVKRPESMYISFEIAKKKGGFRVINSPSGSLKGIQRKLAYILNLVYREKVCAYGFIKGKDIKMNAKQHIKRRYVFNIDLKDFFNNVNFGRVRGMFLKPPYNISTDTATILAQLTCYNGFLPQGAPTSPVITNMICRPLDTQLTRLAKKYSVTYTRYVDDITFSCTRKEFPKDIGYKDSENKVCVGYSLRDVISNNGFNINDNKIFLNHRTSRQEVTGLVVNKFPNIKREYIKSIRAILNNCKKRGVYETAKKYIEYSPYTRRAIIDLSISNDQESKDKLCEWFKKAICGKIRFIAAIRGRTNPFFIKYATECNEIFKEVLFNIGSIKESYNLLNKAVFIIERDDEERQGTGFFLMDYCLVTSYHVTPSMDYTYLAHNNCLCNPLLLCDDNLKYTNKDLDYALYDVKNPNNAYLVLGDSCCLDLKNRITIAGYPSYFTGDSLYWEDGHITSKRNNYLGSNLYTVSSRIIHGSSGGPVVNSKNEVIGIIKGGVETLEEEESSVQGFLPIHLVLQDIVSKNSEQNE